MADEALVSLEVLEDIRNTIQTSYAQHEAWDLFMAYPKLSQRLTSSPLKKKLGEQLDLLNVIIEEAQEEEPDEN